MNSNVQYDNQLPGDQSFNGHRYNLRSNHLPGSNPCAPDGRQRAAQFEPFVPQPQLEESEEEPSLFQVGIGYVKELFGLGKKNNRKNKKKKDQARAAEMKAEQEYQRRSKSHFIH